MLRLRTVPNHMELSLGLCSTYSDMRCTVLHANRRVIAMFVAVQGLERLTRLIFARAQPKRLGSQIISGPMLAGLASAYVEAINTGAVPTISTAWQVGSVTIFNVSSLEHFMYVSMHRSA